jgi:hypothetical protein
VTGNVDPYCVVIMFSIFPCYNIFRVNIKIK